ncbi:MAG: type I glutamate--ammonia ligase [candidate division WOR-3 bacterium]
MNKMYSPAEVLGIIRDSGIELVDFRFSDPLGQWQSITYHVSRIDEEVFENGIGFDGSSIRGFTMIYESDMLLIPDPSTFFIDILSETKKAVFICDVYDPIRMERFKRDPRYIAKKAEEYLKSVLITNGDPEKNVAYFGPELEFFILDSVEFGVGLNYAYWRVDSEEGWWNRTEPSSGYRIPLKRGYFPASPLDKTSHIRDEIVKVMREVGIPAELHHHEVASGGQAEIGIRFDTLLRQADKVMVYKYIARMVGYKHGKFVTFMPKVYPNDNGSGMHTHFSIWNGDKNLFAGTGYAGISEICLYAIGGILKHAPAIAAFTNPTITSYHRLIPGFEAPVNLAYSARNRSAAIRIPMYSTSNKAKRIEVRFPDPSSNPYLAFSAILMAAIDGIENKIHPGDPIDKDIYNLPPEILKDVPKLPGSLKEAIEALKEDHEFLTKAGVFPMEFIELWIKIKEEEIMEIANIPHPKEFELYFDL